MSKELVSIISPCYNVGPYIGRFLDSLISQTYKNLEIILVNDGATDNTGEIIESYLPRLKAEGYKVLYIVQENGGQSSAVNNALKYVTGKFLTWPDPDDWLTPDSIDKRVIFLQNHPEVGMVRCNIEQIDEESGCSLGFFEVDTGTDFLIDNAFEKLVFCRTWFGAMACMLRMSYFDEVVKDREIYVTKRGGQNWQMMLPMAYNYPIWQMSEVLGYYHVRRESHSHSIITHEQKQEMEDVCESILLQTLSRINLKDELLIHKIKCDFARKRFSHAYECGNMIHRWTYGLKYFIYAESIRVGAKIMIKLLIPYSILKNISRR